MSGMTFLGTLSYVKDDIANLLIQMSPSIQVTSVFISGSRSHHRIHNRRPSMGVRR
jgi:hypothetical protein